MKQTFLNIGCGNKKLDGFINIDKAPAADLQIDVTNGLPFPDNSISGIYSEHFIEHLSQKEAVVFLRECRRVLTPNSLVRIATPDLDVIIEKYRQNQPWLKDAGYDWVDNRCEALNIALRDWGHQWVYTEEELVRIGILAGLDLVRRCQIGESDEAAFRGLEWRRESNLIVEFKKNWDIPFKENPLVSILIPAYNPKYFRICLESAINQSYKNIEIIICDDCPTDQLGRIVEEYSCHDKRIKYFKNEKRLIPDNYIKCFALSSGEYTKFLNDDDALHLSCVERMVECLQQFPEVTLVTSHRQCIDASGNFLPDCLPTKRPVKEDSIINGIFVARVMLRQQLNFIGEPTTVMFRRRDLSAIRPDILCFAGRRATHNSDVATWLNLLSRGDVLYLTDTLSYFRLHDEQQQKKENARELGMRAWLEMKADGVRMGMMEPHNQNTSLVHAIKNCSPDAASRNLWGTQYSRIDSHSDNSGVDAGHGGRQVPQADRPVSAAAVSNPKLDDLMERGEMLFSAGDLSAATKCFQEIIDFAPDSVRAINNLGEIAMKASMLDSAQFFFKQALALDPLCARSLENFEQCLEARAKPV